MGEETYFRLKFEKGNETYRIEEASYNLYHDEDLELNNLCILVSADDIIGYAGECEDNGEKPNWELNFVDKDLDVSKLAKGFKAQIPEGYNKDQGGWITNIYMGQHEGTDANTIEVLDVDGTRLLLLLKGESEDFYHGWEQLVKYEVRAWFHHNKHTMRSME